MTSLKFFSDIYGARFVSATNVSHGVSWQTFPSKQSFLFLEAMAIKQQRKEKPVTKHSNRELINEWMP